MRMMENAAAIHRLPRKSNLCFGIRSIILMLFRRSLSTSQRKTVRVIRRAENIEAMMPSVRVTANPLTDPVACQKRMTAVMRVETFASKIALKAFS